MNYSVGEEVIKIINAIAELTAIQIAYPDLKNDLQPKINELYNILDRMCVNERQDVA